MEAKCTTESITQCRRHRLCSLIVRKLPFEDISFWHTYSNTCFPQHSGAENPPFDFLKDWLLRIQSIARGVAHFRRTCRALTLIKSLIMNNGHQSRSLSSQDSGLLTYAFCENHTTHMHPMNCRCIARGRGALRRFGRRLVCCVLLTAHTGTRLLFAALLDW